jgi:hypothetical protein
MAKWPWIERTFSFDYPAAKFPDILERVRGTPARIEDRVGGLPSEALTRRAGKGWSIQENVGHLLDLGYLPLTRIEQILRGESVLIAADMSNRRTHEADHNASDIKTLLAAFREERGKLVARLEQLDEADWGKSAMHPRLRQAMRIVDVAYFDAEHDDYHVARISELVRTFIGPPRA